VLIPGNHDCFDERSVYRRFDFREIGPHVHTITQTGGATLHFDALHTTIWGRGLIDHAPENRPLAGVPARSGDRWHLGLAHGHFAEDLELRSSLITPGEIAESGLDYLALGHVHVFRDVSQGRTRACYPGTPAPLHGGQPSTGSVARVTLDPDLGVAVEERRLSPLPR
jgi:DNA repair exonuclease SbcCD nuclease subunit